MDNHGRCRVSYIPGVNMLLTIRLALSFAQVSLMVYAPGGASTALFSRRVEGLVVSVPRTSGLRPIEGGECPALRQAQGTPNAIEG